MRRFAALLLSVATVAGATTQPAYADPFVVVAPSVFGFMPDGDFFRLTGPGFLFVAETEVFGFEATAAGGCLDDRVVGSRFNCVAGDVIDMSLRTRGEVAMGHGPATINGTSYPDVTFFGDFTFTATPSLFPTSSEDVVSFSQPFVFNGALRGVADGRDVFDVDLLGTGRTSRAFFRTRDGAGYNYQMETITSYVFDESSVTPTPEPTSMLLLGTGLAGVIAHVRRRRR